MSLAVATALVSAVALLGPFLALWAQSRVAKRAASGTVAVSEASTLWAASQNLISQLQAENAKLITQRDRLISVLDEGVMPLLERNSATIATILALLRESTRNGTAAPVPPP